MDLPAAVARTVKRVEHDRVVDRALQPPLSLSVLGGIRAQPTV